MGLAGTWVAAGAGSVRSLMNWPQVSSWQKRTTDREKRRRNSGGISRNIPGHHGSINQAP